MAQCRRISPYIREGSGLKPCIPPRAPFVPLISPYIREGSGLKHLDFLSDHNCHIISPYIREGSGLKPTAQARSPFRIAHLPLHP